MILATAVEMACYVLLEPDLFNVIALVKTLITFSLWMKDEKQWVRLLSSWRSLSCDHLLPATCYVA